MADRKAASGQERGRARDWSGGVTSYLLVWGLPMLAVAAGAFAAVPVRTAIWCMALLWMGAACMLNARRCGRVHCRYTGPYYLALVVPVLAAGTGAIDVGTAGWVVLAAMIFIGGKAIWWITETAWGSYRA